MSNRPFCSLSTQVWNGSGTAEAAMPTSAMDCWMIDAAASELLHPATAWIS
jgi:hypothetical protein